MNVWCIFVEPARADESAQALVDRLRFRYKVNYGQRHVRITPVLAQDGTPRCALVECLDGEDDGDEAA
mgnify:CR=1 FL=1